MKRVLRLNLKREYWEEIKNGSKEFEYRRTTPYWLTRLGVRAYDEIHLCLGYPNRGDEQRILKRKWMGTPKIVKVLHKHFGEKTVSVFAIDVSVPA